MPEFKTAVTTDTGVNETLMILKELKTEIQKQAMAELRKTAVKLAGNIILLDGAGANGVGIAPSPWIQAAGFPQNITADTWIRSDCYPNGRDESPAIKKALDDRITAVMNEDFITGVNMLVREHLRRTRHVRDCSYELKAEIFPDQTSQDETTGVLLHGKSAGHFQDRIIKRLTEGCLGWTIQVRPGEGLMFDILDIGDIGEILERDDATREEIREQVDERTKAGQAALAHAARYVAGTTEILLGIYGDQDPRRHEYMMETVRQHLANTALRNFTLRMR